MYDPPFYMPLKVEMVIGIDKWERWIESDAVAGAHLVVSYSMLALFRTLPWTSLK